MCLLPYSSSKLISKWPLFPWPEWSVALKSWPSSTSIDTHTRWWTKCICLSCFREKRSLKAWQQEEKEAYNVLSWHIQYWNALGWSRPVAYMVSNGPIHKLTSCVYTNSKLLRGYRNCVGYRRIIRGR
jgi:hypothetical protein